MADRFQILSLDGGGIKGIFSAALLAALEEDLEVSIVDNFDLIVGTSTGGIIALGLGAGLRPREMVDLYVSKGSDIFAKSRNPLRRYFTIKYENDPLETALKECFGERTLQDSQKRLVIPSYNLDENDVYLFKTPHHERFRRDYRVPMWQVGMATSAAPTYFPAFSGTGSIRLIDGGVWANNPVMVGIVEAVSILGIPLSSISAFSVGTTCEVALMGSELSRGGLLAWRSAAIQTVLQGQSNGATAQAKHLLRDSNFLRCDPMVPENLFALDKVSTDSLIGAASHHSRVISPLVKDSFGGHVARTYKPASIRGEMS